MEDAYIARRNEELSKQYLTIAHLLQTARSKYQSQLSAIHKCRIDITECFGQKGNLEELSVPGIGPKIKKVLEFSFSVVFKIEEYKTNTN